MIKSLRIKLNLNNNETQNVKRAGEIITFNEESKIKTPHSKSNDEDYLLKIRSPDGEYAIALEQFESPQEINHLRIYKNALRDACTQNNFLRKEIVVTRRKTNQLKIENQDMKEVICELSESINYMTNGLLEEKVRGEQQNNLLDN